MSLNLLIGGAAGQGIDTTAAIFEKLLKQTGYYVYTMRDFMSRVRGGHNFILIRFGAEQIFSHSDRLDGIVALNEETIDLHRDKLNDHGFILCDQAVKTDDPRSLAINMQQIAKDLGNPRVSGSVAVGALLSLFGLNLDHVRAVLPSFVKPAYLDINVQAIEAGFHSVQPGISSQPGRFADWMILSGNQALALGALAAGVRFYSAYPMSPSTSIMEYLAAQSTACGVVVELAEDEIAAMNMAIGASFAGVRAMTGTSGGGFCLKVEALGLAGIAEIPIVVADIQRPGPATGLPTRTEQSDLKFVISAAQGEFPRLVIALRNHLDAFRQTIRAFKLAEQFQIPVILLSDQYLADTSATIEPFDLTQVEPFAGQAPTLAVQLQEDFEQKQPADADAADLRYRLTDDGVSPRVYPGHPDHLAIADSDEHDEIGNITESATVRNQQMDKRLRKLEKLRQLLQEPELIGPESAEILLIGWGSLHGPLTEAVGMLNEAQPGRFAALVFGDIYPLPTRYLTKLAGTGKRLINVEQNATGQLAGLIREQTGLVCQDSILKYDGRQISGEEIRTRVEEVIA